MKKNIFMAVFAVLLVLVFLPAGIGAQENPTGQVTISVEKFTLGLGYIIEPTLVPIYEGDMVDDIVERISKTKGIEYKNRGEGSGFYLERFRDNDHREVNVPKYITEKMASAQKPEEIQDRARPDWLGEFDYTSMSGWMYWVNNEMPNVSAGVWPVKDGDVIRWQFTVWGYGLDLGKGFAEGEPYIDPPNKDALTAKVAAINGRKDKAIFLKFEDNQATYQRALDVLGNMESTESQVEEALAALNAMPENPADPTQFEDIDENSWYYQGVSFVFAQGIMKGTAPTRFSPQDSMTRAMFVTVLGRHAGIEDSSAANPAITPFIDAKAAAYYAAHVLWAYGNGITKGTTANTFSPGKSISREEMAVMIARFAAAKGWDLGAPGTEAFADDQKISSWAKDAVYAMRTSGIIAGKPGNLFDPQGTTTRAEVAVVLYRLLTLFI